MSKKFTTTVIGIGVAIGGLAIALLGKGKADDGEFVDAFEDEEVEEDLDLLNDDE